MARNLAFLLSTLPPAAALTSTTPLPKVLSDSKAFAKEIRRVDRSFLCLLVLLSDAVDASGTILGEIDIEPPTPPRRKTSFEDSSPSASAARRMAADDPITYDRFPKFNPQHFLDALDDGTAPKEAALPSALHYLSLKLPHPPMALIPSTIGSVSEATAESTAGSDPNPTAVPRPVSPSSIPPTAAAMVSKKKEKVAPAPPITATDALLAGFQQTFHSVPHGGHQLRVSQQTVLACWFDCYS
jgi:hypothetical protein